MIGSQIADKQPFWAQLCLDAIITIVDSQNVLRHLDGDAAKGQAPVVEVYAQIAYADRILVNKQVALSVAMPESSHGPVPQDLIDSAQATALEARINSITPTACIFRTERSKVDLTQILDINAFRSVARMHFLL